MIHVDHNHSTSPLKSSASAAALDSFTWDVGGEDPFGPTTTGMSVLGRDEDYGGADGDPSVSLTHAQEFRPEEFLNDDLGDVMHLPPDDVDVGEELTSIGSFAGSTMISASLSLPTPSSTSSIPVAVNVAGSTEGTATPGPPSTEPGFLASPTPGERDRSSSLSPVPETNSPSGHGEEGKAGEVGQEKEAEAPVEEPKKEEEEEEESGAVKAEPSRPLSPLSPLTPPADELDGEGDGEGEEKKEGEKKAEEAAGKDTKPPPQQKQQMPLQQQQKQPGGQTKSPLSNTGGSIPTGVASTLVQGPQQQQQQLRPSPDSKRYTPDPISLSANSRDPKVVKVLDLNVELLNVFSQFHAHGIPNSDPRFLQYAGCLKTNLSWLAAAADGHFTMLPNMDPPPHLDFTPTDRIRQLYAELPTFFAKEIARIKSIQQQQQLQNMLKRDRPEDPASQMMMNKRRDTGEGKGIMAPPPPVGMNGINSATAAVSGGTPVNGRPGSGSSTPNPMSAMGNPNASTNPNLGAGANPQANASGGPGALSNSSTPTPNLGNPNPGAGGGMNLGPAPTPGGNMGNPGEGMGLPGAMAGMTPEQQLRARHAQMQRAQAQAQAAAAARQMSPPGMKSAPISGMSTSGGTGNVGGGGGGGGNPSGNMAAAMFQILQQPGHPFVNYMTRNVPGFQQMPVQMQVQKMMVAQATLHQRQEQQQAQHNQQMQALQARAAGGGGPSGGPGAGMGGGMGPGAAGFGAPGSPAVPQGTGGMMAQGTAGGAGMGMGAGGAGGGGMQMDPRMMAAAAVRGMDMNQQRQLMLLQQQRAQAGGGNPGGGGPGGMGGMGGPAGMGLTPQQQMAMQQERLMRHQQALAAQQQQQQAGNMMSPTHASPVGGGGMGMGMGGGIGSGVGDGFVPPATLRSNPGTIPGIARSTRSPSDAGAASPMTPRVPSRSLSSGPMGIASLGSGAGGAIPGTEEYQRILLQQQQGQAARLMQQQQQQGNGPQNQSFNSQGWAGAGGNAAGGFGGVGAGGGGDVSRQMSATSNPAGQQGMGMGGMGAGMGMGGMGNMGMSAMNGGMNVGGMGGGIGSMGGMGGIGGMGGMGEQGLGSGDYDFLGSTSW